MTLRNDAFPTDSPTATAPTDTARDALDRWLVMWNSDGELARQLCADDFRIRFAVTETDGSTPADDIRTAEEFVRYLAWWHREHPGVVFTRLSSALDGEHGRLIWDMEAGDVRLGGVDVFDFAPDGRVSRVWSVGGQRSLRTEEG
ncbi:nuclear transport factor 2 family protein [Herbiconiux sp. CPCC 205716]|uniref:Nuclear transport factor 2 family protein n=1 Tax=Herbiconiux gentiana TaxID=2970912 RepID=A0ABT2GH07_9MICO|nr:nuclear transport factor 2 family protein [Herbiconiux gentiana]MCS5714076.1 nuclear transport factor 2 family protein [Herbiconiux gentiana]